ncbi:hypothetical protein BDR03DRAFT_969735 [Suillus americanus]|nr:hypothetical protein BDR03DRAFT_969735 [Suillus americanus]
MNLPRTNSDSDVPRSSLDSLSSSQSHSSMRNNQSSKSRPRLRPVYKGATMSFHVISNISQSNENDTNSTNVLLVARQITDNSRVGSNGHTL